MLLPHPTQLQDLNRSQVRPQQGHGLGPVEWGAERASLQAAVTAAWGRGALPSQRQQAETWGSSSCNRPGVAGGCRRASLPQQPGGNECTWPSEGPEGRMPWLSQVAPSCRVEYAVPRQGPKRCRIFLLGPGGVNGPAHPLLRMLGDGVGRDERRTGLGTCCLVFLFREETSQSWKEGARPARGQPGVT